MTQEEWPFKQGVAGGVRVAFAARDEHEAIGVTEEHQESAALQLKSSEMPRDWRTPWNSAR